MRSLFTFAFAFAVAGCAGTHSPDPVRGQQLFTQYCAVCHGPEGRGAEAPSLRGEAARKNPSQLEAWIKSPLPPMPTLYPKPLGDADVADVVAYVETLK